MSTADIGYATRRLLKGAGASLAGKTRGPDHDPTGQRRTPHRDSWDVDDPKAKPWSRIGDGSVAQGLIYCEALLQAAEELYVKHFETFTRQRIREAKQAYAAISVELQRYIDGEPAPVGRPATLRRELGKVEGFLKAAAVRLQRTDIDVLKATIRGINFATGQLFPAQETIAERAGCHPNSVKAGLRRLKEHGFITWVRRTIKTGAEGMFAPQREQTSNAYYFEHRTSMPARIFQRYWQILVTKLRRLGKIPPGNQPPPPPPTAQDPDLIRILADLEAGCAVVESAST
ncbi:MAG: hypothetical protein CVT77_12160 [Alphaproteobacteria bacterium HGW-Alphaproteobacteria-16]|nr:MAG: hypothetical protein CVT77_12160 [Alphaproteobacteria bacterium HGW-Alphaproteobacteria-16]